MTTLLLPLVAVVAGTISFSSPCCLPLIPGYLSYISALPVSELGRREARAVTLRAALGFVAGFTVVNVVSYWNGRATVYLAQPNPASGATEHLGAPSRSW